MIKLKHFVVFGFFLVAGFAGYSQQNTEQNQNSQEMLYTAEQQKLRITAENVRLIPDTASDGYHLYVKKLPNVNSILLTETTKDPLGKSDSYAYRAKEYNPINGDEIRYLDGKPLKSEIAKYSLVDSTVENTAFFGPAFHIYIPQTILYGYEWSRNGEVKIGKGTFINIRSFERPYADYSGSYMDSPFMFDLKTIKKPVQKTVKKQEPAKPVTEPEVIDEPETILTDDYNPVASDSFKEITDDTLIYSKGPETIIEDIKTALGNIDDYNNLDVVFAIDATGSMKNDIDKLKADLVPALQEIFGSASSARAGLLFYRDYGDTFKYMELPVKMYAFTSNLSNFSKNLNSIRIYGTEGGDMPEAVYEALYASSQFYKWRSPAEKRVILIGDAQPHPSPRGTGKYSKEYVMNLAKEKEIKIRCILLPQN